MKKKMLLLIGMFICIFISACGEGLGTKTDNGKSAVESKNTEIVKESNNTEKQIIEETEKAEVPTERADEILNYNTGDKANLRDWEVSVTEMKIVDSITADYGIFNPESDGNKYAQVFVSVTNNGKKADTFLPSFAYGDTVSAQLVYGDGYEFTSTELLGYNADMHNATINPLTTQNGEIAFEIPDSVVNSTDELLIRFTAGNNKVDFKLR